MAIGIPIMHINISMAFTEFIQLNGISGVLLNGTTIKFMTIQVTIPMIIAVRIILMRNNFIFGYKRKNSIVKI